MFVTCVSLDFARLWFDLAALALFLNALPLLRVQSEMDFHVFVFFLALFGSCASSEALRTRQCVVGSDFLSSGIIIQISVVVCFFGTTWTVCALFRLRLKWQENMLKHRVTKSVDVFSQREASGKCL